MLEYLADQCKDKNKKSYLAFKEDWDGVVYCGLSVFDENKKYCAYQGKKPVVVDTTVRLVIRHPCKLISPKEFLSSQNSAVLEDHLRKENLLYLSKEDPTL